jgi:hypothetical protein
MVKTSSDTVQPVSTESLDKSDFVNLFVEVVNMCQPEHPSVPGAYPLTRRDIEVGYCRTDSNTWARCGPRSGFYKVFYAFDTSYFRTASFERVLAITVHELTHITIGRQNGERAPMHPPSFWNEMAYHAQVVLDNFDTIVSNWGAVDPEVFRQKIIDDPNSNMVDRRSESVREVKHRLETWVGSYRADTR